MKWWEDSVDEMLVSIVIGVIACFAIWKGGSGGMTVAGSAVSGLCVYVGFRHKKKSITEENGGNNEEPTV